MEPAESFIRFLQSCLSPIILISGVGLILLTLNHRIGRTIDKSRSIVAELERDQAVDKVKKQIELGILFKRSRILRNSISSLSFSILTSTLIIPVLLVMNLFNVDLHYLGILFFLLSIVGILVSAVLLFIDVTLTLKALEFEVKDFI
ncbi:MAG: DUF2721 domain-containing protein [Proteobacteria bacterium]|nr:DUF2721 domain-containing protein [Pseudomonadota bacterium]MBU1057461.1 DUF2721 domain-containing protein [Pseudomonadota bacterium]